MLQKSYRILLKITKYEKDLQLFSHGTARFFSCEVLSRKNPPLESRNSPLNSAVKKNKPEVEKVKKSSYKFIVEFNEFEKISIQFQILIKKSGASNIYNIVTPWPREEGPLLKLIFQNYEKSQSEIEDKIKSQTKGLAEKLSSF